jgi:hypothetical protein
LINPSDKISTTDSVIDIVIYSVLNYLVLVPLLPLIGKIPITCVKSLCDLICIVIIPCLWVCVFKWIVNEPFLQGKVISTIPQAWDHCFFKKENTCFILVHLNDGDIAGGLYFRNSFASSYPSVPDIYIEEVWSLSEAGEFIERIEDTNGILIKSESIKYLEFFNTSDKQEVENG